MLQTVTGAEDAAAVMAKLLVTSPARMISRWSAVRPMSLVDERRRAHWCAGGVDERCRRARGAPGNGCMLERGSAKGRSRNSAGPTELRVLRSGRYDRWGSDGRVRTVRWRLVCRDERMPPNG
jgi:hypothetical protein